MEVMGIIKLALQLFMSLTIGFILANLKLGEMVNRAKDKYAEYKEQDREKKSSNMEKKMEYDEIDEMLTSRGVKYRMGAAFGPFDYLVFRLLGSVAIGLFSMLIKPALFLPCIIGGYFFIGWFFKHKDDYDNGEMMEDISQLYGIVALQLKNNVFVSEVIYECFLCVQHPRLKKALLELSMEVDQFSLLAPAAEAFRKKFNNEYIDMFAKTLEQLQESGNAVDLFTDLESQIKGINEALAIREEKKIDDICGVFQIFIFLSAILFVAYIMVGMLSDAAFF